MTDKSTLFSRKETALVGLHTPARLTLPLERYAASGVHMLNGKLSQATPGDPKAQGTITFLIATSESMSYSGAQTFTQQFVLFSNELSQPTLL